MEAPLKRLDDDFNLGIYRMQVTGRDRTLMRWLKHRGGAQHHARWKREKTGPLPAAAVILVDSALHALARLTIVAQWAGDLDDPRT